MTNKLNDETVNEDREIYSRSFRDECVKSDGKKTPVKKDTKTLNDEISDYIFTKKRRVKKHRSEEKNMSDYIDNYELVKSDRSNDRIKKRRHKHKSKRRIKRCKETRRRIRRKT